MSERKQGRAVQSASHHQPIHEEIAANCYVRANSFCLVSLCYARVFASYPEDLSAKRSETSARAVKRIGMYTVACYIQHVSLFMSILRAYPYYRLHIMSVVLLCPVRMPAGKTAVLLVTKKTLYTLHSLKSSLSC